MTRVLRVTVVLTHPIQYYSPWFRYIAAHVPELQLTVLYITEPTEQQQGVGFGTAFRWDVPLREGYESVVLRPPRPNDSVDSDRFWGLDATGIGRALHRTRPDVVLLPGWHSAALVKALAASRLAGIPVLYRGDTHQGNAPSGWRSLPWRARSRVLLEAFDGYLSVGSRVKDHLLGLGIDHRRVFDSPHAVDNERFAARAAIHQTPAGRRAARESLRLPLDGFVILFVGKLQPKKRPLDLISAVARLRSPATVFFVGAGELETACRQEAARLNVDIRFAGFVNQENLGRVYAASDCLVLPSDWGETWGLVVNEAFATGLPAVVSDRVGGACDLVNESTGRMFRFGDVDELARAIDDVRLAISAGTVGAAACRSRVDRFTFAHATSGLVDACCAVTRRTAIHRPSIRVVACCGHMVTTTGLERMTFEVLGALRARGAAVHCIVNSWEHHRITPLADRIGATWSVGSYRAALGRRTANPVRLFGMLWDVARTSAGLIRDIRRVDATHVLVPDHLAPVRNLVALAWFRRRGTVLMRLGNAPDRGVFYRAYWRWIVNGLTDRFICNSQFTERELLGLGVPPAKVSVVYNCLPADTGGGRPARSRIPGHIVYVGQIIPGKGVHLLLEALALLVALGRQVSLDVIGDIDGWTDPKWVGYREGLRARAARPDLEGRVAFLGWRNEVTSYMARASVHCAPSLPSLREGFGVVNLEAKAAGTPSVVFASGAFPELFTHGEDGWVCTEVTPSALAEGLEYFLSDPMRLAAAEQAARRSLARFDRQTFATRWWNAFSSTTKTRRARRVATTLVADTQDEHGHHVQGD